MALSNILSHLFSVLIEIVKHYRIDKKTCGGSLLVLTSKEWHDLHADEYDASYESKKWVEIYDRITWDKTIKPYLPRRKSAQILDAGGGTGKWAIPIAKLDYHVTLTDVSERMLQVAKQKLARENLLDRVRIVTADIIRMDMFEEESFDFVLCEDDPLSYCTDPPKGIKELVRVAKKDSIIVASVDNFYSYIRHTIRQGLLGQVTEFLKSQWVTPMGDTDFPVYFFKPGELVKRFEEADCKVEKTVGKNIFSGYFGEDRLKDPKTFEAALKLELDYCDDPYMIGQSGHIAIVCKKQDSIIPPTSHLEGASNNEGIPYGSEEGTVEKRMSWRRADLVQLIIHIHLGRGEGITKVSPKIPVSR